MKREHVNVRATGFEVAIQETDTGSTVCYIHKNDPPTGCEQMTYLALYPGDIKRLVQLLEHAERIYDGY